MKKIAIISMGWLGQKFYQRFHGKYECLGSYYQNKKENFDSFKFDINGQVENSNISDSDLIFFNLPPSVIEEYNGLDRFFKTYKNKRIIFISSTAIYEEDKVANELSIVAPIDKRAQKILALETSLQANVENYIIIRSAGLYGDDRHPGQFLSGKENVKGGDALVNLVGASDLLDIVERNLFASNLKIINAVNSHHPKKKDYYPEYCKKNFLNVPTFENGGTQKKVETAYEEFIIDSKLP